MTDEELCEAILSAASEYDMPTGMSSHPMRVALTLAASRLRELGELEKAARDWARIKRDDLLLYREETELLAAPEGE